MSAFPGSPRVIKGGIVLIDPEIGTVLRVIPLQYNPETVSVVRYRFAALARQVIALKRCD